MSDMERTLEAQTVEGEIGLVIDYQPGQTLAIDVLQAAMEMIHALDRLDATLLSSVDTSLQPVSVLNDVQHSSLKLLLARALKHVPDETLGNLDWKKWVGGLLVKGKHKLLSHCGGDAPDVVAVIEELTPEYRNAPVKLVGYEPPKVADVMEALDGVAAARAKMRGHRVTVQTELGDIELPDLLDSLTPQQPAQPAETLTNKGTEFFKVKTPDLLGSSQWTVVRNNRNIRVDMLHRKWLEAYHRREHILLPGDSLKCRYEEAVTYDAFGNELERHVAIIEVLEIISPPTGHQEPLALG